MATPTELASLIANGENSGVEFKRGTEQNFDLAKELVAFSNSDGGVVLLGVEDDGSITGVTRPRLEEWVMTTCRDKIRPAIIPRFENIKDAVTGMTVAMISVPRGYGVYSRWHENSQRYYIRVGSQSREATTEELARLFQQRRALRAELQPLAGSNLSHLDLRRLVNYFRDIRAQIAPALGDASAWSSLLENTEFIIEDAVGVGGMLLFGIAPNRFLPQAGIDCAAYAGREKDYASGERLTLRGPLTPLRQATGETVELGLVEHALAFIRRNATRSAELIDGRKIEPPIYPEAALRETIVNALIHRDYLLASTDIELSIYADRLEVISPGRLPNGITPARMRAGTRAARNQLLKDVMRDYGYLEHMGMGVPRKIIAGMNQHNGTEPDLIESDERFTVRLWAAPHAQGS
ncbi:MAG TPA: ATP-binding protein [Terriglobales bacterium]|nr:ATP-binding protein [Terriglobales bacterium]